MSEFCLGQPIRIVLTLYEVEYELLKGDEPKLAGCEIL